MVFNHNPENDINQILIKQLKLHYDQASIDFVWFLIKMMTLVWYGCQGKQQASSQWLKVAHVIISTTEEQSFQSQSSVFGWHYVEQSPPTVEIYCQQTHF